MAAVYVEWYHIVLFSPFIAVYLITEGVKYVTYRGPIKLYNKIFSRENH